MFSAYKSLACILLYCGACRWPLFRPCGCVLIPMTDLPYSNEQRQGFENKLAELIARDLGTQVLYTWYPQREKFFRNTLSAGLCDVVLSVPTGFDKANTTHPYYRSSYVFLSRH
jgi:ABC-type amino acid transport substrate-binding protein